MKLQNLILIAFVALSAKLVAAQCNLHNKPAPSAAHDPYNWKPYPDKVALLVLHAHADDEIYALGAVLPYYAAYRKLPVVTILMCSGTEGQWTAGKNGCSIREQEMLCAASTAGMTLRPVFGQFQQGKCYGKSFDCTWCAWGNGDLDKGRDSSVAFLTAQIRRFKPDVIVTHDFKGEYGHPNHKGCAHAMAKAYEAAADASRYPEQLDTVEVWQAKKLYIHKLDKNGANWETDAEIPGPALSGLSHSWSVAVDDHPIEKLQGKTVREISTTSGDYHASQGGMKCGASSTFGLYKSTVGADVIGKDDFFENIDISKYSGATQTKPAVSNAAQNSMAQLRKCAIVNAGAGSKNSIRPYSLYDARGNFISAGSNAIRLPKGVYIVKKQ